MRGVCVFWAVDHVHLINKQNIGMEPYNVAHNFDHHDTIHEFNHDGVMTLSPYMYTITRINTWSL